MLHQVLGPVKKLLRAPRPEEPHAFFEEHVLGLARDPLQLPRRRDQNAVGVPEPVEMGVDEEPLLVAQDENDGGVLSPPGVPGRRRGDVPEGLRVGEGVEAAVPNWPWKSPTRTKRAPKWQKRARRLSMDKGTWEISSMTKTQLRGQRCLNRRRRCSSV
jgi:hypothetical protein